MHSSGQGGPTTPPRIITTTRPIPEAEAGHLPLHNPDVWWTMVLGSGYRGTVDQLSVSDLARVRAANDRFIRDRGVRAVEANAVFAVAGKPA